MLWLAIYPRSSYRSSAFAPPLAFRLCVNFLIPLDPIDFPASIAQCSNLPEVDIVHITLRLEKLMPLFLMLPPIMLPHILPALLTYTRTVILRIIVVRFLPPVKVLLRVPGHELGLLYLVNLACFLQKFGRLLTTHISVF